MEVLPYICFEEPEDGFGLQQAVLEEVGRGERGATMLVWGSSAYVAATRLETRLPGFGDAVDGVEKMGFPVMVRNSGGGAVAANEGSLSFSLTFPVDDMRRDLYERYTEGVGIVAAAFRSIGVDAEGGEVAGEFCPGEYSVRSGGPEGIKLAGLAQRVTKRAARVEALILVNRTERLVPILEVFYRGLGLPFRPSSIGDLPLKVEDVVAALATEVGHMYGVSGGSGSGQSSTESRISPETLERAKSLRGTWRATH